MIVLHASFPIDPEKMDEALDHAETLVEETNEESGVIDHRATRDVEDEHTLRFFEQYEDEAAVEHHTQSDHFQAFEAALPDLLAGGPDVTQFEVSDATELEI